MDKTNSVKLVGPKVTDAELVEVCKSKTIESIELENCASVTDISPLTNIPTLKEAHIINCKSVRYIGDLGQKKTNLHKLILTGTPLSGSQKNKIESSSYPLEVIFGEPGRFTNNMERPCQSLVKSSIDMIRDVAKDFKPEEIGIAFNGGKDSVVAMDLIKCALGTEIMSKCCIFTLGTNAKEEFHEIVSFRNAYVEANHISLITTDASLSMKDGLSFLKNTKNIGLVFMGSRSSDSAHQKKSVERTTAGWPNMLRACPVFHWEYCDIWGYTLNYNLPFCRLYELGYTSLGGIESTAPNPLLQRSDGTFRPAWELHDCSAERNGRLVRA